DHKTTQNILKTKAFTVSLADRAHMDAADFFGIATGNKMADKFERTGYHAAKSERVNAPIIEEFRLYNKSWGKEQKSGQSKPNQVKWKCKNPQPEEGILCPRKIIAQNS